MGNATSGRAGHYRPVSTGACRCNVLDAYQVIVSDLQRQIDEKRDELSRLSRGGELARQGHIRLAIVQLLREMSPHVMPYATIQAWLWGDESPENYDALKAQVYSIRKTRYGLAEDEQIVTVDRVGYRLVRSVGG